MAGGQTPWVAAPGMHHCATQTVRYRYPALFGPAEDTMQLFMWQPDNVGVAHFVTDCFDPLGAAADAHDDGSLN